MTFANKYPPLRPSLLLDFAGSKTVDPRIKFSRASTATYFDEFGVMQTAPAGVPRIDYDPATGECRGLLVEEQRTNLLKYSEQFDNAAWSKIGATVSPNVIVAPDGTLTADKLVEDSSTDYHSIGQNETVVSGQIHSCSVYLKAGERTEVAVLGRFSGGWGVRPSVFVNLSEGTISGSTGDLPATITNVGNGWYRVSIFGTPNGTSAGFQIDMRKIGSSSYTGDGTSGIYIWGAQFEAGSFPTSYIPSSVTFTGRASAGTYIGSDGLLKTAASGEARYQYNPLNLKLAPKLLLEEQRTNLLKYSEQFDNAEWTKTNATVTTNATTAPDGSLTAAKLIPTAGAVFANAACAMLAQAKNATYSGTIYVKAGTGFTFAQIAVTAYMTNEVIGYIDLATGAVSAVNVGAASGTNVTAVNAGNSWWRVSVSGIPKVGDATSGISLRVAPATSKSAAVFAAAVADGSSGIYVWGAQLEEGSYPTSYIKTEAAQVTRVADSSTSAQTTRSADLASMTGASFSDWYRQDEGAFVCTYSSNYPKKTSVILGVDSGNSYENTMYFSTATDSNVYLYIRKGGASQLSSILGRITKNNVFTAGVAYKLNDSATKGSSGSLVIDNACEIPEANKLQIGAPPWNQASGNISGGYIRRIAYYPRRITNEQLQALTAI